MNVSINCAKNTDCGIAVERSIKLIREKLPLSVQKIFEETKIIIVSDLIESGGQTFAEEKKIILDIDKNKMSLEDAENLLVELGILDSGDWTRALPKINHIPWSCLTYQLVHEFGHMLDGLSKGEPYSRIDPSLSPTKYGETSSSEAFAEVFTYWVFDLPLNQEAKQLMDKLAS